MALLAQGVISFLESFAQTRLAEDWDNVGWLLGDPSREIQSVMTCLTLTPDVAFEAIEKHAGLVITHHPILFRGTKRITTHTDEGRMLMDLIRGNVAVYSPHTAFDNGTGGINPFLAEQLKLTGIQCLRDSPGLDDESLPDGSGRFGDLPETLPWEGFRAHLSQSLQLENYQFVGTSREIRRVGIACGAAGEYLSDARKAGCDVFITGETRFHTCLEARSHQMGLILLGHYASERPALEMLANRLSGEFPGLTVWASQSERDPIEWSSGT